MSKAHEATPLMQTRKFHQTTSLIEKTWVDRVEQLPSKAEYLHSALMGLASFSNVMGSCFAINAGAHMVLQDNGLKMLNPFFFCAMGTSLIYFGANAIESHRIYQRRAATYAQIEEQRRIASELMEVIIGK